MGLVVGDMRRFFRIRDGCFSGPLEMGPGGRLYGLDEGGCNVGGCERVGSWLCEMVGVE